MEDLFDYLLVSSDPVISSHGLERRRQMYAKRHGELLYGTVALLASPQQQMISVAAAEDEDVGDGTSSSGCSSSKE